MSIGQVNQQTTRAHFGSLTVLAYLALALSVILPPVGMLLGVLVRRDIRHGNQRGKPAAIAAHAIGLVLTLFYGIAALYLVV
jgi:hypothetical protein